MKILFYMITLGLFASPARAVRPTNEARQDARRFGLDRPSLGRRQAPTRERLGAFDSFNSATGGNWLLRSNPRTGLPAGLVGGRERPRPGRPEDAARNFLTTNHDMLGIDASSLRLERSIPSLGQQHLLFRQTYRGIPVEAAAVKVHMDGQNAVLAVHSSFEPDIRLPDRPSITWDAAVRAAIADAHGRAVARSAPTLVVLPLESDGHDYLAWKLRIDGVGGSWKYFVDALTGKILLRYSAARYLGPCLSSGVVRGAVYDIDATSAPVIRAFNDQYVYVGQPPTRVLTQNEPPYGGGFFCSPVAGKVTMSLQGPWVSVSEFRGPNAHFDNGDGVWSTVATAASSPHPYSNSSVAVSTINLSALAPTAVEFLPIFQNFSVGGFSGGGLEGAGDTTDNDQVFIYDSLDNPIASYIGNRGTFHGASVHGSIMHIALRSNEAGTNTGYDVAASSYMTMASPNVDGAPTSSHTWVPTDQPLNLRGEMDLFYHLNQMHNYFLSDVNKSSAATIVRPVVAMAHVGPDLVNAFYDPDYDTLSFGDVNSLTPSDAFTDDATVPRHEYVHYVIEKIWSIQNYGQGGTMSEAFADYFSASSLNISAIGTYVVTSQGGSGPLRELDCVGHPSYCHVLPTGWTGEIHDDSMFVSQALWDIRRDRIVALGSSAGRSCADGLVFQSLLFFPESFAELYESMQLVNSRGLVSACGGAGTAAATAAAINSAFSSHGLFAVGGDAYESNDGFETATDVSTIAVVSATIYPTADQDFYSFGSGPGLVTALLSLPMNGSYQYKAYQLKLFNSARHLLAWAAPPYDGFATTFDGVCNPDDCTTSASQVSLSYNNPAGGLLYLQVVGGDAGGGSNSAVNSGVPYRLSVAYPRSAALSGSLVSASFDNDIIGFTVYTSTFVRTQDWRFAYAQLRDQAFRPIPNTVTNYPTIAGDWLTALSSVSAGGLISGTVRLSPGFAARFPAYGTVYLEVFGFNVLQGSSATVSSMGLSNPLNLTASVTELTAYNNLFNPTSGQNATVKYSIIRPGHLTIKLYTATGRFVKTLFDGESPAGKGSIDWDGRNAAGSVVASGVYIVRAQGPDLENTQKIVVIK